LKKKSKKPKDATNYHPGRNKKVAKTTAKGKKREKNETSRKCAKEYGKTKRALKKAKKVA
jgi:hypothetical protein